MIRKGTSENRELAFRVYARHEGRNLNAVIDELRKEHGLNISVQTLCRWKREGDWDDRLSKSSPSIEEGKLLRLMGLIERFERQLLSAPRIEPQEAYAYTNMIGMLFNLLKKSSVRHIDPARMKAIADQILESEYGIKRNAPDVSKA